MNMLSRSILALFISLFISVAFADQPYDGEVFLKDEGRTYNVMHVHSRQSKPKGLHVWYGGIAKNLDECDHTNGHQGILQIFKGDKRVYCTAPPALTHLWLSPDEKYVVGLSDIYARNSHQLVVYSTEGELLYNRKIECDELSSFCVTTNSEYIFWYHQSHPAINLEELESDKLRLTLNDKYKQRFTFTFSKKPEKPLDQNACGRNREPYHIKEFWNYYIQDLMYVSEKHDDMVCVYYKSKSGSRAHYYISRGDFENRKVKENSYREFLSFNFSHFKRYPKYLEEYFSHERLNLMRVTGLSYKTAEEWVTWWEKNKENLVLSEDGKHLLVKAK